MKLATALRLGRVSNLPTVTSNVIAGVVLAGTVPGCSTLVLACLAMSLMYVAGMFLNDAFDREIDAVERPERPIPSGEVTAAVVFDAGFVMLGGGIAIVAFVALTSGAGWKPIVSATALGSLIIIYDAHHKANPLAPLVMGLCRAGVYATAALLVCSSPGTALLSGIAILIAYLIGLTFTAKQENLAKVANLWPLVFLAVPFIAARPHGSFAVAIYVGFFAWVVRALILIRARRIKPAVISLIAGISLVDALLIANLGRPGLAVVALAAFLLTTMLQRVVPGT